jgi:hypothetical protein
MAKADLIKQAQELGVELTGEETVAELEPLIASVSTPPEEPEMVPHIVTEEDLANNPELAKAGIQVGDEIQVPKVEDEEDNDEPAPEDTAKEQDSYYVWTAEGDFYKCFSVAEHGADAEKKAKALAEEIGGSVQ